MYSKKIAVVIPYFQREPGILKKALASVFASDAIRNLTVVVIDDASPEPAQREITELGEARFPVSIIRQPNAGPGGARNMGLENIPDDTDYVAFLDSDDIWFPQHLKNALLALNAGYDVYFSDHIQLGAETSAFRRAGKIDLSGHSTIAGENHLHAYSGDMFDQIITGNVIGTSTVVFDYKKFRHLRFRTDLTTAGEDYLFWLELALGNARFSFGSSPEVEYGKGVNVYAGSGWGTDGHARRIYHELRYRRTLKTIYRLNSRQRDFVGREIRRLRQAFVADCLHRLVHRKKVSWDLAASVVKSQPQVVFHVIPTVAKSAFKVLTSSQRRRDVVSS